MTEWIILSMIPVVFAAYMIGKKSRKVTLEGLGAKEAFAYFARHEIHRHLSDIARISKDLENLRLQGVDPPDIPVGFWWEVG